MTLHFHWLHAPRWLADIHVSRAMRLVLGVVGVSLLFSALRVIDVAVSGVLVERRVPVASGAPDVLINAESPASGIRPVDADLVDVPEATAEAISL